MESLSDEILVRIFSFLTVRDLCRCSQVSIILYESGLVEKFNIL